MCNCNSYIVCREHKASHVKIYDTSGKRYPENDVVVATKWLIIRKGSSMRQKRIARAMLSHQEFLLFKKKSVATT